MYCNCWHCEVCGGRTVCASCGWNHAPGCKGCLAEPEPEQDICRNRHRGAPTSVEAFRTTPPSKRADQRGAVFKWVVERGDLGATTEEVSLALGIPYTAASARMSELKAKGALMDSGRRRLTSHHKSAAVLVLAPEAEQGTLFMGMDFAQKKAVTTWLRMKGGVIVGQDQD